MNEHEEKMFMEILNERNGCGRTLLYGCIVALLYVSVAIGALTCLCGCKTQYIPVETVRKEYISRTDTVKQTDSVFMNKETIIREADSALVAKLGLQLKDNERAILILQKELERKTSKESEHRTDTIIKTDTIQVPVPVERELSRWERFCIDYGKITLGVSIADVLAFIVWLVLWLRKKGLFS